MELPEAIAPGLRFAIDSPVTTRWFDDKPRLFGGGLPITAVNLALRGRLEHGATRASIKAYAYAASLFLSFLASRRRALIEATNSDFVAFCAALVGQSSTDADGQSVRLPGERSAVTAHNVVARLYGLFGEIEAAYGVTFDWRRFKPTTYRGHGQRARAHTYRLPQRAPLFLPDTEFGRLLEHAVELWADYVPEGDRAFAADPESQRGALLARNVAVLMLLRYAGARRAEVAPLDLGDIDRAEQVIRLVTKGRQGAKEPVVLLPVVEATLMRYILFFRPHGLRPFKRHARQAPGLVDRTAVLLSHSAHGYGERISDETVRGLVDRLRPALDTPWRDRLTPHLLRHSFAHELQRTVGSFAASANLRHRAQRSIDPYRGDATQWAETLSALNEGAAEQFARAGISSSF